MFGAALEDAREGVLELHRGRDVVVRAAEIDLRWRAIFDGPVPKVEDKDGHVLIAYPRFWLARLLRQRFRRAEIELNAALPWSLAVTGGLCGSVLDLRGLELAGLALEGGARDLHVVLPAPRGRVRVRIEGGASAVAVLRPPRAASSLQVAGGASRLAFDRERYGAIGGEIRLETPNAGPKENRYEIEITGGASKLTIAEAEQADRSRPEGGEA